MEPIVGSAHAPLRLGVVLPQGLYGEGDVRSTWAWILRYARAAEELGYDDVWLHDHVQTFNNPVTGITFEPLTTLGALTQLTSTVGLGVLVLACAYRNPVLTAQQSACLATVSGGRFTLGLGAGWSVAEHESLGIPVLAPRQRIGRLGETVQVVKELWTSERVNFRGEFIDIRDAAGFCTGTGSPPPLLVASHGLRGLRIAARFADIANFNCAITHFGAFSERLRTACAGVGRDHRTIRRSIVRLAGVIQDPADVVRWGIPRSQAQEVLDSHLVGTAESIRAKLTALIEDGAADVILFFPMRALQEDALERFREQVVGSNC